MQKNTGFKKITAGTLFCIIVVFMSCGRFSYIVKKQHTESSIIHKEDTVIIVYEPATLDNPILLEAGDRPIQPIQRYFEEGKIDWFSIYVRWSGILVLKTTGRTKTFMQVHDKETGRFLTASGYFEDDELNALIVINVEGGKNYLVSIKGGANNIGEYQFEIEYETPIFLFEIETD